jgi:hypothetical protein
MIARSKWFPRITTLALVSLLVPMGYALLTYTVNVPGNVTIVSPGSVQLIAVYQNSALTQNLTSVSFPTTQPYAGQLVSQQTVYLKNVYSAPVNVTVTVTGLPSGISFTPIVITNLASGAVNSFQIVLTLTTGVSSGNYPIVVVFSASKN